MSKAAEVKELLDLYEMIWKDGLSVLQDLVEGITAASNEAQLHFLVGFLLLLLDASFIALGGARGPPPFSYLGPLVFAGAAAWMFGLGYLVRKRYLFMRTKYSGMVEAARKYRERSETS